MAEFDQRVANLPDHAVAETDSLSMRLEEALAVDLEVPTLEKTLPEKLVTASDPVVDVGRVHIVERAHVSQFGGDIFRRRVVLLPVVLCLQLGDLIVGGQVVPAISSTYDHFWNSGWAFPAALVEPDDAHDENALAVLRANLADRELILEPMLQKNNAEFHDWRDELVAKVAGAISGSATVLVDRPDIHDPEPAEQVSSKLKAAIDQVQEEIVVVTPYLVPPPGYMDSVWELESRDVEMIILTNSLNTNNHVSVHAGYSHHRGDLLEAGVDLHEYRLDAEARQKYEAEGYRADSFTVHAKVLVMDRRQVFVGTFNMDPRSMFINTELGLLIDSPELAKVIRDYVLVDFQPDNSWKVIRHEDGSLRWVDSEQSLDREPSVSTWRRFQAWLLGLFPIENQL